jgi:hypothetical protein
MGYTYHIDLLSDTLKEIIVKADQGLGAKQMAIPAIGLKLFGFEKLCARTFIDVIEEYAVGLKGAADDCYDLRIIKIVNKDPKTNYLFEQEFNERFPKQTALDDEIEPSSEEELV